MKRAGLFALILLVGLLVFFVAGYWSGTSPPFRVAAKTAVPAALLLATLACRRYERLRGLYRVALGFLAASCGFLASWLISDPLLRASGLSTDSVPGIACAKFFDAVPIVVAAFVVSRLGGNKPADLYLQKGKVKTWLITGMLAFLAFLVLFLLQTVGQGIEGRTLLAYAPWTALFVFSNAFMEEFHFRGLLLRSAEDLLGRHLGNVCIALLFTVVHAPVRYTPDILAFLVVVFVLALAWGVLIQRSEALWGAVLFHAGADLMIIMGIYKTYL
ncbi:MAG: CPBP family intramembrane glutamic endopeptidase [Thermoanaerobaculia bacterium]